MMQVPPRTHIMYKVPMPRSHLWLRFLIGVVFVTEIFTRSVSRDQGSLPKAPAGHQDGAPSKTGAPRSPSQAAKNKRASHWTPGVKFDFPITPGPTCAHRLQALEQKPCGRVLAEVAWIHVHIYIYIYNGICIYINIYIYICRVLYIGDC